MSKHTPGPWTLFIDNKHKHNAGIEAENEGFSIVPIGYPDEHPAKDDSGVHGRTKEEALANAYLIAAAPDLLEALESIVKYELTEATLHDALSAIAKAKGEIK